jgi:transcriptional regulator with XRE-family HTH domain
MNDKRRKQILLEFGQRVRRARTLIALSQEALALSCELDRTYIGGVERGERNVSLVNIYRISEALKLQPRDLFDA